MSSVNLLEKNVEKILSSAGFDPQLRADLDGYEIDVYVEYKSERIAFECKQYQRGSLTVRNLIHQWNGKQEELGVDRVVLVLVGVSVSEDDYELAENRELEIWRGEKVDSLLDEVVDGTTNLREKILLDLDLGSDEEIEGRIEEIMESYNVQRDTAIEYLRGEITKSKLKGLRQIWNRFQDEFPEGLELSDRDVRRYKNDGTYYGKPFRDVLEKMSELGIQDKKVARLFVGDKGGTAHGESYSTWDVEKIELIVKEFDYSFERAKEFVFQKQPKKRKVKRAVSVRSERPDLELEKIYRYLEGGFTVREIKKGELERRYEEESEENGEKEDELTENNGKEETEEQDKIPVINSSGELVAGDAREYHANRSTSEDSGSSKEFEQGNEAQNEQHSEIESKNSSVSTPLLTVLVLVVLTVLLFALLA